jgi:hypothetical protein
MIFLNAIQELMSTAIDAIKAKTDLIGTASVASATDVSGAASDIIGGDGDTLETLSNQIDGLSGAPKALKTMTFADTAAGAVTAFTVTGFVKIALYVRCKTDLVSAAAANISLGVVGSPVKFIAATLASTIDASEIWTDASSDTKEERYYDAVFEYVVSDDDVIVTLSAQVDSGVLELACEYTALSSDGAVVAA